MLDSLAHCFLPRPSNNHKAKLIQNSSIAIIIALFIFFQGILEIIPKKPGGGGGQVLGYAANIAPSEVERLTNIQREKNGLGDLTDNQVLDAAALAKGKDMLAKGYWAHVAPDGTQPWAFFVGAGYSYKYAGENLARDFSDASSTVNAWMASPTHRENVLSANYKDIGIGVVEGQLGGADTTIVVQFFGTKLGDTIPVQPIAQAKTPLPPTPLPSPTFAPTPVVSVAPVVVQAISSPLVAGNQVTPFNITRYLSLGLVGILILVVAIDGFLINRRRIFRIAGHFPAHIAFLGMILCIIIIAKAGRVI